MRSRFMLCLAVLAMTAGVAGAAVTMTNIGSFSISGTKPATGQVGYYGNAVAFVPAGQDSINQDTLIITWAQTDPVNSTRRLFLFHRITIPAPNGTPTILCTATLPSDVTIAGTQIGATAVGTKDLVYDPVTKKVVGAMTVSGNRVIAFDLFSANVTLGSVSYSAATGDTPSPSECFFLTNDGRYTAVYKTSSTNWRKISIGRNQLDGATAWTKQDVPTSSFTGWYPDPSLYPYNVDSFCATGGAGFYGSTAVIIRSFKNSANANAQECRLYAVGQAMDATAINAYMDLGAVPGLNGNYIGYGMAFDKATGNTYVRTGYTNDAGSAGWNRIFMVNLTSSCDAIAPDAVTNLAASEIGPRELTLSWAAPADASGIFDGAASYDVRYSASAIDDTNWDAATQVTGEPQPSSAGATDSLRLTGLTAATDYFFAVKSTDTCGIVSALSNIAPARTLDPDVTPPAAVGDLAASDVHPNSLVLHWTATGDDGMVGQAAAYDLRYSTSPIDATNFDAATAIPVAAPKAPGSAESLEMHNLTGGATYYFAIKVIDEWPLTSAISNVLVVPMPAQDNEAPYSVTDLTLIAMQSSVAHISFTAPADGGSAGVKGYEIRYSTSAIDASNWSSATIATAPAVATPGTLVRTTVGGLVGNTLYYIAIKSFDWAEPSNVSDLSNVISGTTKPPISAITLHNPWIVNDRVADCRSLETLAATFANAYTPDGVIVPSPTDTQTIAINSYNNFKRREYHWADDPPNRGDVVKNINIHGHSLCGGQATQMASIHQAQGIRVRTGSIASGAHTLYEVFWDNDWHLMDTMTTMYVFDRATPPSIASAADIKADKTLMTAAVAEGRACPGFLLCPDDVTWFANGTNSWSIIGEPGSTVVAHSMNMDLRFGETLDRTWNAWENQHPTPRTNADTMPGNDPPYHHDAHNDWKDHVNYKYWEPYGLILPYIHTTKATYRRWSNGTYDLKPDFKSAGYQAAVHGTPSNIGTIGTDGLMPELHASAANTTAEIVFKIKLPYEITDANISGQFVRTGGSDIARLFISTTGTTYTQIWDHTGLGTTQLNNLNVRTTVFGKFEYYIKVQLKGVANKTDAGVNNLVISSIFQHNKGAMAYLDKGLNTITVTFDNAAELASSGAAFKVTYKWKEYDGAGWNVDKTFTKSILTSPTTFTINVGGTKVPRTESVKMELAEPEFDPDAPSPVTTLAVASRDSAAIGLTWTATGDDAIIGQASLYDIRYSTTPFPAQGDATAKDAWWAAATEVDGEPAPAITGSTEQFLVTGLESSTTYFFVLKVADDVLNWSGLSNDVSAQTLPPDIIPPAWVGTLVAKPSKVSGAVELTWTATADDDSDPASGAAKTYDLRYSTSAFDYSDEAAWAAATPVTGLPAPKAFGQAETFTVTGLTGGTEYFFALKVADERPNWSECSNVSSTVASVLGEKTLQNGTSSYNGCRDSYTQSGTPTTAFGSNERMRVTGYADLNDTQRGYVKFDLTGIPAGTVIRKATLKLYSYDTTKMNGSSGFYAAHRITRTWNEQTLTYNNADSTVPWTVPGGDYEATADALSPKYAPKVPSWYSWNLTTRVQEWIDTPAGNFGWLIRAQNESSHLQDQFYQSDTANAAYRPMLVVSDMPEPLAGDVTYDGHVDVLDLLTLAGSWGKVLGERGYEPKCDLNPDGAIDVVDLLALAENWGL